MSDCFFVGIILGFMALHHARKASAMGKKVGWAIYVLVVLDICIGAVQTYTFIHQILPVIASTH